MRFVFTLSLLSGLGLVAVLPSDVQAGPFIYRGGPWDRWVGSGYRNSGSSGTTYYLSPSRDDPGILNDSQTYYDPGAYTVYRTTPWSYTSPSRDNPGYTARYGSYYYYTPSRYT